MIYSLLRHFDPAVRSQGAWLWQGRIRGLDEWAEAGTDYGPGFAPGDIMTIPRRDLPFGLPSWHGDADHAKRNGNTVIEWRRQPV